MLKDLFLGKQQIVYEENVIDILRLIRSENVGPKTFFSLIKCFGDHKLALENIGEFSLRGGRSKPIKIFSKQDAEKELDLLEKHGAKLISYLCPGYSDLLKEIHDFPPILTYKGNIELFNDHNTLALVGARNASMNGRAFASKIAHDLKNQGYVIVSGLARGVDTAAHQVAIDKTIAVIAGGIDHIYPPENAKLYEEIAEKGLIIAELPIGSKPLGQHFPQRNRLISGLSLATIVIEASLKSGSLITAKFALEQNREIFAVPGFPLDPRCQGTNQLIKDGAMLITSAQDIMENLPYYNFLKKSLEDSSSHGNNFKILESKYLNQITDKMRRQVTTLLSSVPVSIESLITETDLPLQVVHIIVLELELAGNITRYPGNKISLTYK